MSHKRQQGYMLLALLLVLFVSGTSFVIGAIDTRQSLALREQSEVTRQLALAKEALLAYAASTPALFGNDIGPGYLPCPDADNSALPDAASSYSEDDTDALCPAGLTLGRLPQYVVTEAGNYPLNSHFAGRDQQFWYAVSPLHLRTSSNTPSSNKTNAALSRLTLDGTSRIVALIIAPGEALDTQDRASNPLLYSNYLDGTNGSSATSFISSYSANPAQFNDSLVAITHDELMHYVGTVVAARLQQQLETAYGSYPNCLVYNWFGTNYTICPYVHSSFLSAWAGDWIAAEQWNAYSGSTFNYMGNNYYNLSRTLYYHTTPGLPQVRFFGCNSMNFQLSFGAGITRQGDSCG